MIHISVALNKDENTEEIGMGGVENEILLQNTKFSAMHISCHQAVAEVLPLQCSEGRVQNIQSTSTMHTVLLIFAYTKTHDEESEVESEPERLERNMDRKAETSCVQAMHRSQIDKKLHVCACFPIFDFVCIIACQHLDSCPMSLCIPTRNL